jgi:hypothetical protein
MSTQPQRRYTTRRILPVPLMDTGCLCRALTRVGHPFPGLMGAGTTVAVSSLRQLTAARLVIMVIHPRCHAGRRIRLKDLVREYIFDLALYTFPG